MNNCHECQCNCPNEDWHYELMYWQKNPEPYILSEYDLNLEIGLSGLN
jgi:hypothetical protein